MAKFHDYLKRASSLVASKLPGLYGFGEDDDWSLDKRWASISPEGETIFCKNNVCVHSTKSKNSTKPTALLHSDNGQTKAGKTSSRSEHNEDVEHNPGYLTIRAQVVESTGPTMVLTWVPNATISKSPKTFLENRSGTPTPLRTSSCPSPAPSRLPTCDKGPSSQCSESTTQSRRLSISSVNRDEASNLSNNRPQAETYPDPDSITEALQTMITDIDRDLDDSRACYDSMTTSMISQISESDNEVQNYLSTVSGLQIQRTSPSTEGESNEPETEIDVFPDSVPPSPFGERAGSISGHDEPPRPVHRPSNGHVSTSTITDADSSADTRSLSGVSVKSLETPLTSYMYGKPITGECPRGTFSVDLRHMKSLRIFYSRNDEFDDLSNGQLVIASRESQYKVFHFHRGGLDKLASVLEEWQFFRKHAQKRASINGTHDAEGNQGSQFIQFSICRPQIKQEELHPEESLYGEMPLDEQFWALHCNEAGQIEGEFEVRRLVFFSGVKPSLRRKVWPFLLYYYPFDSTEEQRQIIREQKRKEYHQIEESRLNMNEKDFKAFWKSVQSTVEKDVVRTDRNKPLFAGEDNQNIEIMKRILLNYAVYNPVSGYTQGMSDLCAPLLAEMGDEADTFWCFIGLMDKMVFVCSPKDIDMDAHLTLLRELLRIMLPEFFHYLCSIPDALELLFAHRWIILCFKREFPESDSLRIWEAAWAHYETEYFHLFVCLSIISIYGQDIIDHRMRADEILFHFSTLTRHMNGDLVLRKARGLLHQFRSRAQIPCTLGKIREFKSTNPGLWDSGSKPQIECVQNVKLPMGYQVPCNCLDFSASSSSSASSPEERPGTNDLENESCGKTHPDPIEQQHGEEYDDALSSVATDKEVHESSGNYSPASGSCSSTRTSSYASPEMVLKDKGIS